MRNAYAAADARRSSASSNNVVEEMPAGTILNLDDPHVGIETQFASETLLDLVLGCGQFAKTSVEDPVCGTRVLEGALRRGPEQFGRAVKPIELDEYGSGLFGAAPADGRERPFDVAAADIGGNPDCRFEAHSKVLAGGAPRTYGRTSIPQRNE